MRRILFVDDEPAVLEGLRNLFRKQRRHWEMVFAPGGMEALDELERTRFDVVVATHGRSLYVLDDVGPLEELTVQQRENITLLKEKLDLNERQVRRALDIIGEANVAPELLAAKLVEVAERYKVLLAGSAPLPGDSPNVIALKGEAQKVLDEIRKGKDFAELAKKHSADPGSAQNGHLQSDPGGPQQHQRRTGEAGCGAHRPADRRQQGVERLRLLRFPRFACPFACESRFGKVCSD